MRSPRFAAHMLAAAALLCAAAVAAGEISAEEQEAQATATEAEATMELDDAPTPEQMAADILVVRPLSLVGTVIGIGVFVISTPFCVLAWNCTDPARRLILEPAKYTFTRDLGDLD